MAKQSSPEEAPSFVNHAGGNIEVVVPQNGVKLERFNTITLEQE